MSLVTVSAAESPEESCKNNYFYVNYSGNKQYQCFDDLSNAADSVGDDETAEIVFVKGKTFNFTSNETIKSNVTLNLNGQTIKMDTGGVFTIEGANVTIKNGTFDTTTGTERIEVNGKDKATTLTFANDVTVKGALTTNSVVKVLDASEKTTINVNGKWEIANEIVNCVQDKDENLTINLNAKVTGTNLTSWNALVVLDAGSTVVNVNGGTYTADQRAFTVKNGTLNVNAGTIKATGDAAIVVNKADNGSTNALSIKGGDISSTAGYALYFFDAEGKYSISDGTFTSSKDSKGKRLPAIYINNPDFLDNHKNMITGGDFTGSIVGDVKEGERITKAEYATADLVGNATVSEKDGVVI